MRSHLWGSLPWKSPIHRSSKAIKSKLKIKFKRKIWGCNVQPGDYKSWECNAPYGKFIVYLEFAKRVKAFVTRKKAFCNYEWWQTLSRHCGDHFVKYTNAKSLCYVSITPPLQKKIFENSSIFNTTLVQFSNRKETETCHNTHKHKIV